MYMKKNEKSRRRSATAGKVAYGVFVLSLSGILVKVIGLLFKIPLTNMIGESGMGYFNSAYTVYSFFYILSTAGLPIALSIMISSSRQKQIQKRVFNTALALFALMGVLLSCLMLLGAGLLSDFISNPDAVYSIMTMAPCLLFVCIASAYRGYFQGCQSMLQTALSQLIEAAGKLILGMLLALWAIRRGFSSPIVAAFAVLGITLGSGISMLYLVVARRFFRGDALDANESEGEENTKVRTILKKLIKLSVPITASSAVLSLSGLLDLAVVMRRLQQTGYSAELANALYGNYTSLAVPLFNMPAVLITPISCALVPYIAKAISTGERKKAISGAQNCLKYDNYRNSLLGGAFGALGTDTEAYIQRYFGKIGGAVALNIGNLGDFCRLHQRYAINYAVLRLYAAANCFNGDRRGNKACRSVVFCRQFRHCGSADVNSSMLFDNVCY